MPELLGRRALPLAVSVGLNNYFVSLADRCRGSDLMYYVTRYYCVPHAVDGKTLLACNMNFRYPRCLLPPFLRPGLRSTRKTHVAILEGSVKM